MSEPPYEDIPEEKADEKGIFPGELTKEQKAMLDRILEDDFVSKEEFKDWMTSIGQDLKVNREEFQKSQALFQKALADNNTNIVALAEINKEYSTTMPVKAHSDTMKILAEKFTQSLIILALMAGGALVTFFFTWLLQVLGFQ